MRWKHSESGMYDEASFDSALKVHEKHKTAASSTLYHNYKEIAAKVAEICMDLNILAKVEDVKCDNVFTYVYFDDVCIGGSKRKQLEEELKEKLGSNCMLVAFCN